MLSFMTPSLPTPATKMVLAICAFVVFGVSHGLRYHHRQVPLSDRLDDFQKRLLNLEDALKHSRYSHGAFGAHERYDDDDAY